MRTKDNILGGSLVVAKLRRLGRVVGDLDWVFYELLGEYLGCLDQTDV